MKKKTSVEFLDTFSVDGTPYVLKCLNDGDEFYMLSLLGYTEEDRKIVQHALESGGSSEKATVVLGITKREGELVTGAFLASDFFPELSVNMRVNREATVEFLIAINLGYIFTHERTGDVLAHLLSEGFESSDDPFAFIKDRIDIIDRIKQHSKIIENICLNILKTMEIEIQEKPVKKKSQKSTSKKKVVTPRAKK